MSWTTVDVGVESAHERRRSALGIRLNWLRAAVLGANDGIISTAGLVVGVAAATAERPTLLVAGLVGMVAGAFSMAGGEYVSVSTQSDSEAAALVLERSRIERFPRRELEELTLLLQGRGLSPELATRVATELTDHDPLGAHAEVELGLHPTQRTNPRHAALSSMVSFLLGAVLPLLAIMVPPPDWRVPVTMLAVLVALVATGIVSSRLGRAPVLPAVRRLLGIGVLVMAMTYGLGSLFAGAV